MPNELVSVIIPCFNSKATIGAALTSVFLQTYKNIEVIVIDDGSTDGSHKELAKLVKSKKIKLLRQENKGQGAARNLGVKHSRGELLAFLDSDDEWLPNKLEKELKESKKHQEAALIYCNARFVTEGKNQGNFFPNFYSSPPPVGMVYGHLLKTNFIINSSVLLKKSVFKKFGGFSESEMLRDVEDYDLWLRISRQLPFAFTDSVLVEYKFKKDKGVNYSKKIAAGVAEIMDRQKKISPLLLKPLIYKRLLFLNKEFGIS